MSYTLDIDPTLSIVSLYCLPVSFIYPPTPLLTMTSYLDTYLLILSTLTLGLAIMEIMILVKEWTKYKTAQLWPKLPATGPPDLESGLALSEEAWQAWELEASWSLDPLCLTRLSQLLDSMAASH
jgi:hypothetical protein